MRKNYDSIGEQGRKDCRNANLQFWLSLSLEYLPVLGLIAFDIYLIIKVANS